MARPTNTRKGKESLENIGVKIDPALKKAIEEESNALGITTGTYSRQLLITGWHSRHNAPIAKNPREQILIELFNELPINDQEIVLAIIEAINNRARTAPEPLEDEPIPRRSIDKSLLTSSMTASIYERKKGGNQK